MRALLALTPVLVAAPAFACNGPRGSDPAGELFLLCLVLLVNPKTWLVLGTTVVASVAVASAWPRAKS